MRICAQTHTPRKQIQNPVSFSFHWAQTTLPSIDSLVISGRLSGCPSFFRRVTQTGPSPPHPTLPCSREFCLYLVSNIPRQPCSPWSSADFAISGGQEALLFLSPFQGKLSTPSHPLTGGEDKRLEITSLALWAGVAKLPASPAGDERRG